MLLFLGFNTSALYATIIGKKKKKNTHILLLLRLFQTYMLKFYHEIICSICYNIAKQLCFLGSLVSRNILLSIFFDHFKQGALKLNLSMFFNAHRKLL